ncbi:malonate decarboxylase acyl carrier protein [Rhodoplanes azumiensis]|uniref:Malonate decarboxylase acyl carrier protein n=1 Tax=Rhodoplanes azumiensis TaxID=1897628 RepID=A0ABW5APQ3_9BRAD
MALNTLEFDCKAEAAAVRLAAPVHYGVVGSGDLEVILEPCDLGGAVKVKVTTPVGGFDAVWRKVVQTFVNRAKLADVAIDINDNNASPAVVSMRLQQALAETAA